MEWGRFIATHLPRVIKGGVMLVAERMAEVPEPEYPVEDFANQQLEVLNRYQQRKETAAQPPPPDPSPSEEATPAPPDLQIMPGSTKPCPFCALEEKAGYVRNHLEFVASECSPSGLGPATGGMVPKARAEIGNIVTLARSIEAQGGQVAVLARSVIRMGEELGPKLEWVNSCEEAAEASSIARSMWETTAKAAQVNFAQKPGHR